MALVTREQRELSCSLTANELADASNLLASKTMELVELEDRKKSVGSEFTAKINAMAAANAVVARKINSKSELRQVSCEWTFDWEAGKKSLFRTDTGEKISEDFIKDFESQRHFEDLKDEAPNQSSPVSEEAATVAAVQARLPGPQIMIEGECV